MTLFLEKFMFYQLTYGYLITNLLIAWLPSGAMAFLAARDSWVVVFLTILFLRSQWGAILLICAVCIVGLLGIIVNPDFFSYSVFLYGIRSFIFVIFVLYYIENGFLANLKRPVLIFFHIVVAIATIEVVFSIAGLSDIFKFYYGIDGYFNAKGIVSHIQGGLFGDRLTAPFYSASILATFLVGFVIYDRSLIRKSLSILIAFLTLSKVLPLVMVLWIFRKKIIIIVSILILFVFFGFDALNSLIDSINNTTIQYHLASVRNRMIPFSGDIDIFNIFPLGSMSIAGHLILGLDPAEARESLLLPLFFELKVFGFFFLMYLIYVYARLNPSQRVFLIIFITIQLLSSLSNHPVAFIGALIIFNTSFNIQSKFKSFPGNQHDKQK